MTALDDEQVDATDVREAGDLDRGADLDGSADPDRSAGPRRAAAGREPARDAEKPAADAEKPAPDADAEAVPEPEFDADLAEEPDQRPRRTKAWHARRTRAVTSGVVMLAVAGALVVRLGSAPSLLTVGLYGIALILSGTAIVLSRRGRTRVATAVLACGFVLVVLAEQMLPDGG